MTHGTASASPTSGATNTQVTITATPDNNYRFKQWQLISGGVELSSTTTNPATFQIRTANVEVKAHFERTYDLIYDSNGGSGNMNSVKVAIGDSYRFPNCTFTPPANKTFNYWEMIGADGRYQPDDVIDPIANNVLVGETITVKAVWKDAQSNPKKDDGDNNDSDHSGWSSKSSPQPLNPNALISTSFTMSGFGNGNVKIGPQIQGTLGRLAFLMHMPAGFREAFSFNMTVNDKTDYTLKKGTLSFKIPPQHLKEGRTFRILGIDKNGNVKEFPDTDKQADTITVNLDIEGYAFDLIYKD